jgi:hypothetical protein
LLGPGLIIPFLSRRKFFLSQRQKIERISENIVFTRKFECSKLIPLRDRPIRSARIGG